MNVALLSVVVVGLVVPHYEINNVVSKLLRYVCIAQPKNTIAAAAAMALWLIEDYYSLLKMATRSQQCQFCCLETNVLQKTMCFQSTNVCFLWQQFFLKKLTEDLQVVQHVTVFSHLPSVIMNVLYFMMMMMLFTRQDALQN